MRVILLVCVAALFATSFTDEVGAQEDTIGEPIVAEVDMKATPDPWVMVIPGRYSEFVDDLCSETDESDFVHLTNGPRVERKRCSSGASSSKGMNSSCTVYLSSGTYAQGKIKWLSNSHPDCGSSNPTVVLDIKSEDRSNLSKINSHYAIVRCPGQKPNPLSPIGLRPDIVMTSKLKGAVKEALDKYFAGIWAERFMNLKKELNSTEPGPLSETLAKIKMDNSDLLALLPGIAINHLKINWSAQAVVVSTASSTPAFIVKAGWEMKGACVSQAHLLLEPIKSGGFKTAILKSEDAISSGFAVYNNCADWSRQVGDVIGVVDSDNNGLAEILLIYTAAGSFGVSVLEYTPNGFNEVYNYAEEGC